jgi:hypothetical protein
MLQHVVEPMLRVLQRVALALQQSGLTNALLHQVISMLTNAVGPLLVCIA